MLTVNNDLYSFGGNDRRQSSALIKDKYILKPHLIHKENELNIDKNWFIERVIASFADSAIIINPYKYRGGTNL